MHNNETKCWSEEYQHNIFKCEFQQFDLLCIAVCMGQAARPGLLDLLIIGDLCIVLLAAGMGRYREALCSTPHIQWYMQPSYGLHHIHSWRKGSVECHVCGWLVCFFMLMFRSFHILLVGSQAMHMRLHDLTQLSQIVHACHCKPKALKCSG